MMTQKSLRTGFQILALGLFVFQMQESLRKYFHGPTTHVKSQKHISQTQVYIINISEITFNLVFLNVFDIFNGFFL